MDVSPDDYNERTTGISDLDLSTSLEIDQKYALHRLNINFKINF